MSASEKKEKVEEFVFFGEIERHPQGGYSSEYPAWYHVRQLEDMKEELRGKEEALELRLGNQAELRFQVKQIKQRIHDIESSSPKLSGSQKDKLAGYVKEIGETLADSMPTRSDMMRGTADAHIEVRKDTEPCVKVPRELAEACGVQVDRQGRATRDGAAKCWKIGKRALGEESNTEILRRDKVTF